MLMQSINQINRKRHKESRNDLITFQDRSSVLFRMYLETVQKALQVPQLIYMFCQAPRFHHYTDLTPTLAMHTRPVSHDH